MLSFKSFLDEEVKEQFLYHNTSILNLENILKVGTLGTGRVSFSRNKLYDTAPGAGYLEARLIFKYDVLKRKYKMEPHADLNVAAGKNTDDRVKGANSRWESEETVRGPVDIRLVERIEILKSVYKEKMNWISIWNKKLEELEDNKEKLKQGLFWHGIRNKYEKLSDFPKVTKEKKKEDIERSEEHTKTMILQTENIFKNPKIKIVDKFN